MTAAAISAVVAVVTFVFGGSALLGKSARQRHVIKAELDILEKMPAGAGRGLLTGYMDEKVGKYVIRQANAYPKWLRRDFWIAAVLMSSGLIGFLATCVWVLSGDGTDNNPDIQLAFLISAGVSGVGSGMLWGTRKSQQKWLATLAKNHAEGRGVADRYRAHIERDSAVAVIRDWPADKLGRKNDAPPPEEDAGPVT